MSRTEREKITVRWVDAETGEDFTDRMYDPSIPPGEGILELARALGRMMAAQDIEAGRQLVEIAKAGLKAEPQGASPLRTPTPGDELILNGVSYRYDGSSGDADHFTRLKGETWNTALVSLRRGSDEARWVLQQLNVQN